MGKTAPRVKPSRLDVNLNAVSPPVSGGAFQPGGAVHMYVGRIAANTHATYRTLFVGLPCPPAKNCCTLPGDAAAAITCVLSSSLDIHPLPPGCRLQDEELPWYIRKLYRSMALKLENDLCEQHLISRRAGEQTLQAQST